MIGAIVLAAGAASRMGRPKLLLPLQGQSLIRRVVGEVLASAARPVVVVTGAWREPVEAELAGLPVELAYNPDHAEGMSTSLRAGLRALGREIEAAIVLLADQPLVDRSIIDGLIECYRRSGARVVRPRYGGSPGNPVLWASELFPRLLDQRGDQGGRTVLLEMNDETAWLDVPQTYAQEDVDTPEAYEALKVLVDGESPHVHQHAVGDQPRFCPRCAGQLAARDVEGRQRPVCESCGAVFWIDPKVAVAVLIPWEGGLLLGRRAIDPGRDRWSFPAGYVDRGELLEAAASREVLEETGLNVRISGLVGAYSTAGRPLILIAYAGEVVGGTLSPGPEVTEIGSFSPSSLPEMAFEHDERIVADWLAVRARRDQS